MRAAAGPSAARTARAAIRPVRAMRSRSGATRERSWSASPIDDDEGRDPRRRAATRARRASRARDPRAGTLDGVRRHRSWRHVHGSSSLCGKGDLRHTSRCVRAPDRHFRSRHAGQPATSQRSPLSRDRPLRGRAASPSTRGTRCTGKPAATRPACRSSSCTAARAAAACRIIAATSIRRSGASCCSTSAAPGARRPAAEITDNTTQHLIADLERLRRHLGIERWLLFGGSWGSTLALAYAEAYPQRCLGLVLRGIFLARPSELDWFMHGMRYVFPEAWRAFSEFLPPAERGDLLGNYYRRLAHPDPRRAHARRAGMGSLRRRVLEAPAAGRSAAEVRQRRLVARDRAHRGPLFRASGVPADRTRSSRTSGASGTFRARSSRDATTSSARR